MNNIQLSEVVSKNRKRCLVCKKNPAVRGSGTVYKGLEVINYCERCDEIYKFVERMQYDYNIVVDVRVVMDEDAVDRYFEKPVATM